MDKSETTPRAFEEVTYPGLRQRFRGPAVDTDRPFIAVLGGTETFARHVDRPFADVLAQGVDEQVANLGCDGAGLTAHCAQPGLLTLAGKADMVVLQITGAPHVSNRLYMVHSRRNDRFLRASPLLHSLYPDVDFTDYAFTGHLLGSLKSRSETSFRRVKKELQRAWRERMRAVLAALDTEVVLLWVSTRVPEGDEMADPAFVTREMVEALLPRVAGLVEVVEEGPTERTDTPSASRRLSQTLHDRAGRALAEHIGGSVNAKRPRRAGASVGRLAPQSFSVSSGTASNRSATRP